MMACHGCHQPADYDTMPPRSRDHPWSFERQTRLFSIQAAMLFAVETSSPMQRARNSPGFISKWRRLQLLESGITTRPRQRIATWAILALADLDESIAACTSRGSGPTDHSRLTPSRRGATVGRAAQTQTPKATGFRGLHEVSLESDDTSSEQQVHTRAIRNPSHATSQQFICHSRYRPQKRARGLALKMQSSAIPDWIRRRARPSLLPSSIHSPHHASLSSMLRAVAYASAHVTRCMATVLHKAESKESFR